jgi:hypothetical protein
VPTDRDLLHHHSGPTEHLAEPEHAEAAVAEGGEGVASGGYLSRLPGRRGALLHRGAPSSLAQMIGLPAAVARPRIMPLARP